MDNEESTQPIDDKDITHADTVEYFHMASVSVPCGACGYSKWTLSVGEISGSVPKTPTIPLANIDGEFYLGAGGLQVIFATCERCSYIRFHAKQPIREWVKNNKPPFKANEPNK